MLPFSRRSELASVAVKSMTGAVGWPGVTIIFIAQVEELSAVRRETKHVIQFSVTVGKSNVEYCTAGRWMATEVWSEETDL